MTEPVVGDDEAARLADAMQATHFRGVLAARRAHLDAVIALVREQLEPQMAVGDRLESHRLHQQMSEQENELQQLDCLIRGLDRRFTDVWADLRDHPLPC